MSEFKKDVEEVYGTSTYKVIKITAILVAIYLVSALVFGLWPLSVGAGLVRRVVNEHSIIQNYEWFYDQYNSIQAQKANYESMSVDAYERNGLRMVLNNNISEYNSKSKQITRNLWKANDLPYQLDFVK